MTNVHRRCCCPSSYQIGNNFNQLHFLGELVNPQMHKIWLPAAVAVASKTGG
jgi:hypothetical protein